jgi:hypothetical protein
MSEEVSESGTPKDALHRGIMKPLVFFEIEIVIGPWSNLNLNGKSKTM